MYLSLNNFTIFITIIGLLYIFIQFKKLRDQVEELKSHIDDYIEFEHKITLLGASPNDLTEYFRLRNKHRMEYITMMVMEKEKEKKIDKDALSKRQEEEIEKLISKERPFPDMSFPIKEEK